MKTNKIIAIVIMAALLISSFAILFIEPANNVNNTTITPNNIVSIPSHILTNNTAHISSVATPYDIASTVNTSLSTLLSDITKIFDSFFQGLVNIILGAINASVSGILGVFGIPFHQWAKNVAQQGLIIPIIFVGVLGIAGAIGYFFFIVYGFEGDIRGGEEDLGHEEENVEEEE